MNPGGLDDLSQLCHYSNRRIESNVVKFLSSLFVLQPLTIESLLSVYMLVSSVNPLNLSNSFNLTI